MARLQTRKIVLLSVAAVLLLVVLYLHLSGKNFVYKALWYNFADIDDNRIFDQRVVPAAKQPQPWPLSTEYNRQPLPETLEQVLEQSKSIAFLVIKDDSIRQEQYWEGYGPNAISNSFSVAKSIVSTLIGIAIRDGHIQSIDQPVADFLPEYRKNGKQNITIRYLLMMSSGLDWNESYSNPLSITTEAYYGSDLPKTMAKLQPEEEPGLRFTYKSGDTQVLAFVLEAATKMPLSRYASERLWQRIGAERDAEWSLDREGGKEKAYCCFFSNARDFARLGKLYLNNGIWESDTLLSPNYVLDATRPHGLPDASGQPTDYYGHQWWIIPEIEGEKAFYARGILGQYIAVVPGRNLIMVRLGNQRGKKEGAHYSDMVEMLRLTLQTYR